MTKGEREELKRLARERARVAKHDAERRTADLKASFEEQIIAFYDYDRDEVWEELHGALSEMLRETNEKIRERAVELGIPTDFAPSVAFTWNARNPRVEVQRSQAEVRRAAYKRLEAMERTAKHEIDRAAVDIQTQLVAEGLTSERAIGFLADMPSVEALMPALDILQLTEGTPPSGEDLDAF
jgi:hypothetical protein